MRPIVSTPIDILFVVDVQRGGGGGGGLLRACHAIDPYYVF